MRGVDMKKLLITGFDPFGGEEVNPSWEAVSRLEDRIGAYEVIKMQLPTVYEKAAQMVIERANTLMPDAILLIGQAGGRRAVTPEVIGINLREAALSDNEGNRIVNEPIVKDGPAAYFSTAPVRKMVQNIKDAGLPAALSYSAGAFVCNDVLYSLLHHFKNTSLPVGFIHVPYLPEQAKENAPSLTLEEITRALTAAAEALPE